MATIGTFKKTGNNEFTGEIVTLSLQTKNVRVVPEANRSGDNAPSHRVFVGRVEIGAAWAKRSNEGRDYLGLKLDDPSFPLRSTPTSSMTKKAKASASSGPGPTAAATGNRPQNKAPPGSNRAGPSAMCEPNQFSPKGRLRHFCRAVSGGVRVEERLL